MERCSCDGETGKIIRIMGYELDPKYDSLGRIGKWDEVTGDVIRKRLSREIGEVLSFDFLTDKEGETLEILTDLLIPQEKDSGYVKIAEVIDGQLSDRKEGVRFGENPWRGEFYRKGLAEIGSRIRQTYGKPIENMNYRELDGFVVGILENGSEGFLHRFVKKVLADSISIFFSHPTAWNKVGFPGPAFPQGYGRIGCGEKEKWEPEYTKKL